MKLNSQLDLDYKRWKKLKEIVKKHSYYYHTLDNPIIPDHIYDSLVNELKILEEKYPDWNKSENSILDSVGGEPIDELNIIKHQQPMLSLENTYSLEDTGKWIERINKLTGCSKNKFVIEYKVDGLAVHLSYLNSKLVKGTTRGNGFKGEDITDKIFAIDNIPKVLNNNSIKDIEVRGELFMPKDLFFELNNSDKNNKKKIFSHSRNAVAGSIRQNKIVLDWLCRLRFSAHQLLNANTVLNCNNHEEALINLRDIGFLVNDWVVIDNLFDLEKYYLKVSNSRSDLEFDIDGIVVKLNSLMLQSLCGSSNKAPKWAFAYKFKSEEVVTQLLSVTFQVGRTGIITPKANFKPIWTSGAWLSNATLHNEAKIKRLNLHYEDYIIIKRSGDVIPKIIGVVESMREIDAKIVNFPDRCPVCKSNIKTFPNKIGVYCSLGRNCPGAKIAYFTHLVSKEALNIDHLGPQKIKQLLEIYPNLDLIGLINLKKNDFMKIYGVKSLIAEKLCKSIKSATNCRFDKFLFAMGIPGLGKVQALNLSKNFQNLNILINASIEDFVKIDGIGIKLATEIYNFFYTVKNEFWFTEILNNNPFNFKYYEDNKKEIEVISAVVTGSFDFASRTDIFEKLRSLGINFSNTLNKNTKLLLVGNKPSNSKIIKAQTIGCEFWYYNTVKNWFFK